LGANECLKCPYPFIRLSWEYDSCAAINLNVSDLMLLVVGSWITITYILGIFYMPNGDGMYTNTNVSLGLMSYTIFCSVDFVTDIQYVLTNDFANITVFVFSALLCFTHGLFFFIFLYKHGLYPRKFKVYQSEVYDNMWKVFIYFFVLLTTRFMNVIFIGVWIFFGLTLYSTNSFANANVQRFWVSIWTGFECETCGAEHVDVHTLNESIFSEIIFEAIPQLGLQVYNNNFLDAWTQAGYISAATSLLCSLNGIYRIIFYKCYLKINMIDVPFVPLFAETQSQDKDQDKDQEKILLNYPE